jgi:superoxide dismutase, Cu-Zn family
MNHSSVRGTRNHPVALATATAAALVGSALVMSSSPATADTEQLRAVLKDPAGTVVGRVDFSVAQDSMTVKVRLRPNQNVSAGSFHGLHVHANNNSTNGAGCVADAGQPSSTWFASADGRLSDVGQVHSSHSGDMPSPLVLADGTAMLTFVTDRIDPDLLAGRAVILHFGRDNFGNVPVGTADDQYLPNTPAATDKTARTGNAGDRAACGVVVDITD